MRPRKNRKPIGYGPNSIHFGGICEKEETFPLVLRDTTHMIDRIQSAAATLFAPKRPEPSYPQLPLVRSEDLYDVV